MEERVCPQDTFTSTQVPEDNMLNGMAKRWQVMAPAKRYRYEHYRNGNTTNTVKKKKKISRERGASERTNALAFVSVIWAELLFVGRWLFL